MKLNFIYIVNLLALVTAMKPSLDEPFETQFRTLLQSPCVSLFTRNGRIGCGTTSRDGMKGRIMHWSTLVNSNYYNGGQLSSYLPKFVAVMDEYEFTAENVEQIRSAGSGLLQGILVMNHTDSSSASLSYKNQAPMSPRGTNTPSSELTPDNEKEWNLNGDGLMLEDLYGVPISYVSNYDVAEYITTISQQQSEEFLSDLSIKDGEVSSKSSWKFPPIVAKFNMYMGPEEMDSSKCLSWIDTDGTWNPKCLPLGGNSVWAAAGTPSERSGNADGNDNNNKKPIIMVTTNMDSTSMFHDDARGANTAASNILTVLMAAKLFGEATTDAQLDSLESKVVFAIFQGENYGYLGSRSFLRDVAYPGIQCDDGSIVPQEAKNMDDANSKMSCLSPLRYDMDFTHLGQIQNMIAVDQVGITEGKNTLYVHDSAKTYYSDGLMSSLLVGLSSDDYTIQESQSNAIPPSPLSSLIKLSGGAVGGVVLAGYDENFDENVYYLSHIDSTDRISLNLQSIANAATVVAKTALMAASGCNEVCDAGNAVTELDPDDETLNDLANCLFVNGNCDIIKNYARTERLNNRGRTGIDVGDGEGLGTPPNYYVSVYDHRSGQPYVVIDGNMYGTYTGEKEYGANKNDQFLIRPSQLESAIYGLLNDYLGRGSFDSKNGSELKKCESSSDCSSVDYCSNASSDVAVCTGGKVCVCSRSHFHSAVDEAFVASPNNRTGFFLISNDDDGVSPMYTEPFWSNDIGVHVYRDSGKSSVWTLILGPIVTVACVLLVLQTRKKLHKEKLY
jgi:nicastrin